MQGNTLWDDNDSKETVPPNVLNPISSATLLIANKETPSELVLKLFLMLFEL